LAPAGDADLIAPRVLGVARLERLHRVAREIEQDAEELVGIGVHREATLDGGDPTHPPFDIEPQRLAYVLDQRLERDQAAIRRRLLYPAIGQRRLAKRDGALERHHE